MKRRPYQSLDIDLPGRRCTSSLISTISPVRIILNHVVGGLRWHWGSFGFDYGQEPALFVVKVNDDSGEINVRTATKLPHVFELALPSYYVVISVHLELPGDLFQLPADETWGMLFGNAQTFCIAKSRRGENNGKGGRHLRIGQSL